MRLQSTRSAFFCLLTLLGVIALHGCSLLYPEPDPEMAEEKEGLKFDEEYYAQNAKEYFTGRRYGRARDQWGKQLQKNPGSWSAKLGIAYCDYYLGAQQLAQRDMKTGRDRLERAEAAFRELWDGTIETDTWSADPKRAQWKAALGLAMSLRGLGLSRELSGRLISQRIASVKAPSDGSTLGTPPSLSAREHELTGQERVLDKERDEYYLQSIALFERLVAMTSSSPESVKQLAELYLITEQDDKAEKLFAAYLNMAEDTAQGHRETQKNLEKPFPGAQRRAAASEFLDEKLRSNSEKQVAVLTKLAGVSYGKGRDADELAKQERDPTRQKLARNVAHGHFERALQHLARARGIQPERLDLLVKVAQCESELGLLESAVDNLDQFIAKSASNRDTFDADLAQAYRLKREIEQRQKARNE